MKNKMFLIGLVLVLTLFLYSCDALQEQGLAGSGATMFTNLKVGDGKEADSYLIYDGNAQDFYIALDDSADDLVVGKGSTVGTTPAFAVDENLVTTWSGGQIALVETVAAANVLTASECGKTMFLSAATEFQTTLPAVTGTAGCAFRFVVAAAPSGASYTIITGNSLENKLTGGINELEVDTGDDGPYHAAGDTITIVDGVAVVGDWIYMISNGTNWFLTGQTNADGGVTIAQAD